MNTTNAATSAANQNMAGNIFGGILSGASGAASGIMSMFAEGGQVPNKKLAKVPKKDRMPMPDHIKGMALLFHPHKFADGGEMEDAPPEEKDEVQQPTIDDKEQSSDQGSVEEAPAAPTTNFSGSGSYSSGSASNGPGGGPSVSLPADQTDFGSEMKSSSSGGGGGGGGGMGLMALAAMAKGGKVRKQYAVGGITDFSGSFTPSQSQASAGPGGGASASLPAASTDLGKDAASQKKQQDPMPTTQGDTVAGGPMDSMDSNSNVSPGGELAGIGAVDYAAQGGLAAKGGKIGGKPKVPGAKNSYANDTQPAMLSPGEIVIPRSVTESADPVNGAAKFVAAILAKHKNIKQSADQDDFKMALKKAIGSRKK